MHIPEMMIVRSIAFVIAVCLVFAGITVIDFFRSRNRSNKRTSKLSGSQPSLTTARHDPRASQDRSDQSDSEINLDWAVRNPDNPVAVRYLSESRDRLVAEIENLEHLRLPFWHGFGQAFELESVYRDQAISKLRSLQLKVDYIDNALLKSTDN